MVRLLLALLIGLSIGMVETQAQADEDAVLFSVADKPVRVSEFEYIYAKNNGDSATYSEASLQEYLDLYINFKLQVENAREMGFHEKEKHKRDVASYRKRLSESYLLSKEVIERLAREAYERSMHDLRVSHIIVSLPTNPSEADIKKARTKIESIKAQTTADNFAETAKKASDDKYSRPSGGDLGWFTAFQYPYSFETAAYETPVGEVSDIIRTEYGFHILKVTDKREALGQVKVAQIFTRLRDGKEEANDQAEKSIKAAYEQLEAGTDFDKVVLNYSEDNESKRRNGLIGWVGINKYPKDFEERIFRLEKDGAYTKPFRTDVGWHILKRIELLQKPSYQEVKSDLIEKIKRDERFTLVKEALVARIKKEAGFEIKETTRQKLLGALSNEFITYQWRMPKEDKVAHKNEVLFTLGNRSLKVIDFMRFAQRSPNERVTRTASNTKEKALDRVLEALAAQIALEYEERNLENKYPEFQALMREYEEGNLLFAAKTDLVWNKASEDEEGLQAFYEANKEKYLWPERAKVTFYTVRSTDKKLLRKIRRSAKKDSPEEVKQAFNMDEAIVQTTSSVYEPGKDSRIDALKWKAGRMDDGYEKDGSSYFVKIEEVLPPSQKTLDQARGYVTADYQRELEKQLIEELRDKFEVEINQEVFKSLIKN